MPDTTDLELTVTLPADTWAAAQRRLAFLEAVLSQVLRDRHRVREWFTARELAALDLPGLGTSPVAIGKLGHYRSWARRQVRQEGRTVTLYHFASLPQTAFEAFIRRIVELPADDNFMPDVGAASRQISAIPAATPQWMLPLMRIIKGGRANSWQQAYTILCNSPPDFVSPPSPDVVRAEYTRLARH